LRRGGGGKTANACPPITHHPPQTPHPHTPTTHPHNTHPNQQPPHPQKQTQHPPHPPHHPPHPPFHQSNVLQTPELPTKKRGRLRSVAICPGKKIKEQNGRPSVVVTGMTAQSGHWNPKKRRRPNSTGMRRQERDWSKNLAYTTSGGNRRAGTRVLVEVAWTAEIQEKKGGRPDRVIIKNWVRSWFSTISETGGLAKVLFWENNVATTVWESGERSGIHGYRGKGKTL